MLDYSPWHKDSNKRKETLSQKNISSPDLTQTQARNHRLEMR